MRQSPPLIVGNWKMNAGDLSAISLAKEIVIATSKKNTVDVVVCPPLTVLAAVARAISSSGVFVGAQDCHVNKKGAHTGDVAAEMIAAAGATYVIVGHSERRADHGETNQIIFAKTSAALRADLTPIVCLGETRAERDAGHAIAIVLSQLHASLPKTSMAPITAPITAQRVVVAYEPIWAIGTGSVATLQDIAEMHKNIRHALVERFGATGRDIRILYGGSLKPDNAKDILAVPHVNGGLIGGASLNAGSFAKIVMAAAAQAGTSGTTCSL